MAKSNSPNVKICISGNTADIVGYASKVVEEKKETQKAPDAAPVPADLKKPEGVKPTDPKAPVKKEAVKKVETAKKVEAKPAEPAKKPEPKPAEKK